MAKSELYQAQVPLLDFKKLAKKLFYFPHFLTLLLDNICAWLILSYVSLLYGVFPCQNKEQVVFQQLN